MRLYVRKNGDGSFDLTADDRRGLTGTRSRKRRVAPADVQREALALAEDWRKRRDAIRDARKRGNS